MSAGGLAFVILRLGAVLVAYQALLQAPYIYSMIQAYFGGRDATFLLGTFGFLILSGTACLLWFGAEWLSGKVVAPLRDAPQSKDQSLTPESLMQVGLVLIGVYILFQASFSLITQLVSMASMGGNLGQIIDIVIRSAILGGFGLLCITTPHGIARILQRLRKAGSS